MGGGGGIFLQFLFSQVPVFLSCYGKLGKIYLYDRSFTVIEANKSGIKFRNKKLEVLNDDYSSVSDRYESQQSAIVAEMLGIAAGYSDIMNQLGLLVSKLDVIVSLALAAVSAPTQFVKPEMFPPTEPRRLDFSQLRHPIIELQVSNKSAFNHTLESTSTSKVSNKSS